MSDRPSPPPAGDVPEPSIDDALTPPVTSAAPAAGRFRGLGRSYWKLWTASAISNLGDGTSAIAYPWLASVLTRDPVLIAGVGVATRLPWLLFSLHAGAIVDRVDRRKLMLVMNAARAALSLAVAVAVLTGVMSIPLLYVTAVLIGCAEVLYDNAAQTILPSIVPKERLERANGNLWGAELVTNQFVGPPLGGFLLGVGLSVPFFVDAGSFAVAAGLVLLIAGTYRPVSADAAAPPVRRRMTAEIKAGVRWLWRHSLLRSLAITLGVINAMSTLSMATFVLFVQEILGLEAAAFGVLMTAGAVGGVLGSQLAPSVTKRIGPGPSLYAVLVTGSVTSAVIGATSNGVVVAAMLAATTFGAVLWNIITVSLRQTIIPDELLGRVNSVYRFFGWGMMPVGAMLGGAIVGAVEPFLGRGPALRAPFGVAAVVYAVVFVVALPRLTTANIEAAKRGEDREDTAEG